MTRRKEITSKLPWAAAATIIVVAVGLGAWALFGGAPGEITPTPGGWTSYVFAYPPDNSGIENIYFVENKVGCIADTSADMSLAASQENLLEYLGTDVIATRTENTPNIPYDNYFQLIVSITAKKPPICNLTLDNLYVWFEATGDISFTDNTATTSDGEEFIVSAVGDTIRVNVVYDNAGAGFKLPAGGSFSYTVKLYIWG